MNDPAAPINSASSSGEREPAGDPGFSARQGHRPINLEKLHEATDQVLAAAYDAALKRAHGAPMGTYRLDHDGNRWVDNQTLSWASFSREAFRIGNEIARRKLPSAEQTGSRP